MSRLGGESTRASIGWTLATALGLLGVGLVLQSRGGFLWNAARGDVARARAEDRRTAGYYEDLRDAGRDLGAASWTSGESDPAPEDSDLDLEPLLEHRSPADSADGRLPHAASHLCQ